METRNGTVQVPVRSIIVPKNSGDSNASMPRIRLSMNEPISTGVMRVSVMRQKVWKREAPDMRLASVTRIVVYKKDRNGNWLVVLDQPPGYGPNSVTVAALMRFGVSHVMCCA